MKNTTPTAYLNWLTGKRLLKKGETVLAVQLQNQDLGTAPECHYIFGIFAGRRTVTTGLGKWRRLYLRVGDEIREIREKLEIARIKRISSEEIENLRLNAIGTLLWTGLLVEGNDFRNHKRRGRNSQPKKIVLAEHFAPTPRDVCAAYATLFRLPGHVFD